MPPLQERYFEMLSSRIRDDQYPSHQLLDRLEASMWTPEQIIAYVELLLEKADQSWYPSHQLLDRIERMLQMVAATA